MTTLGLSPRQATYLALAGATWGTAFLFIAQALHAFEPAYIAVFRNAIAAVAIALSIAVLGGVGWATLAALARRPVLGIVSGAVGFGVPLVMVATAQRQLPTGLVAIVMSATPLMLAAGAPWLAPDERVDRRGLIGLGIGIAGVALAAAPEGISAPQRVVPTLLVIGAAALNAIYPLVVKRLYAGVPAQAIALHAALGGAVCCLPLLPFVATPSSPTGSEVLSLIALGVVATAIPYVLFTHLVGQVGAGRAALSHYLIPFTALVLGLVVLHESATVSGVLGLVLILAGVRLASARRTAHVVPGPTSPGGSGSSYVAET